MSGYRLAYSVHVVCVVISASLFVARGAAETAGADWRKWRVLRVAPHFVDTVFLASAVTMVWLQGLSPIAQPWLAAKLVGLVCYIGLGLVALRFGGTKKVRRIAFAGALVTLAYIVSVALSRDPKGFLALLPQG
ncbi:MAG: SirB2 family protein [Chromatiales bacterium]|jgi:uncharacterized membrane protein SirB2|nr:SirB2 family protein [Chromatiales bacterium]MDH3893718.1 SirB2 family protein [Chromatiales bacterium]MDH3945999.1 SirB2 family protein [Chromatiales bacterium]MDH4012719.1 SirB2 family protein [Chromatiales bacterium]PLX56508.1 MAG: invasion protein [Chromatiales bacterium]